jgi:predicted amidophosphoribosyltransferase
MERCPVCNARLKPDTPICPRCSTDLAIPLNIERQAESWCYQSLMLLGADHLGDANEALEKSVQLKSDPLALALRGFIRHSQLH